MSNAHDVCHGHQRLLALVEFALREGWEVRRTDGGYLQLMKPGMSPIFMSSTASDFRASQDSWARLRRFARNQTGGRHG